MAPLPNYRGPLLRPGGARSSITRDPAAEAYYSNNPDMVQAAVRQGYANGGPVRRGYANGGYVDPMDYVPDPLPPREQQRPTYDPYNTIGREQPKASPVMAYAPDVMGYAEGGPIKRLKNWQDVGVAQAMEDALYEQPGYTPSTGYTSPDAVSAGVPAGYGGYARGGPVGYAEGGEVEQARDRSEGWGDLYERVPELKNRSLTPDPKVQKEGWERMMRKPDISDDDLKAATSMYPPGRRFAEGGEVEDEEERRRREQTTGYAQPIQKEEGSVLGKVMDYIHGMFSVGEAGAAENPQLPQRGAPVAAATPPPITGYAGSPAAGGYGGDLASPYSPPADAREASLREPLPVTGAPLSLQSQAPPSISGQDTPRVAEIPADTKLGRLNAAEAARKPVGDRSTWELIKDVAGAGIKEQDLVQARRELYEGTDANLSLTQIPGRLAEWARSGLEGLVRGDHPRTPEEAIRVLDTIGRNPLDPGHNKMVQDTFNELGKTQGVDAQANFMQKIRNPYNGLLSTGVAALADGRVDVAMKFVEQAYNLLPNERKLNLQLDPKGGGIIATVQPEGPGGGQPMAVRMTAAQFYDFVTGPASQFDIVGKNGIEKNLQKLTGAGGTGLQPGDQRIQSSSPGGGIQAGPGGAPAQIGGVGADHTSSAMGGVPYAPSGPTRSRYDVAQNIGESERPGVADTQAARESVQRIIAGTRKPAEMATQNQTPEGGVLDPTAPARSLTAQDPRSVAARDAFVRQVTPQRPQAAPQMPEDAAKARAEYADNSAKRLRLIEDYRALEEAAKPRGVAPGMYERRADPSSIVDVATTSSFTNPAKGGGGGGGAQSQTPHRTVIPGAPAQYQSDPAAVAGEATRLQAAQRALQEYGPAPWQRPGWHMDQNRPLPESVFQRGPIQQQAAAPAAAPQQAASAPPPPAAVQAIRANPSPALVAQFIQKYGRPAAEQVLRGQ